MPGINISTSVRSGPSDALQASSGQFFMVGVFERGDKDKAVTVRSLAELARNFGNRTTYSQSYDQLVTFFSEGGEQARVARVVGPAAVTGSITLSDRAGTPANTLKIDAANPGGWSSNLTVQVQDAPIDDTFRITVRLAGEIVEDYNNLVSPADAVAKFSNSPYLKVVSLGSTSLAPANNPAVLAATPLTAGNDDRASIVSADYVTALNKFTPDMGDGAVAIPGQTGGTVLTGLAAHAKANNRTALGASAKGDSVANLQALAASLNSEYLGIFAPWVNVPDASAAGTRTISPEGYVAACRARAHTQIGPWRAPAGAFAIAQYVTGVDQAFTAAEGDSLDAAKVSVIRNISNTVRLYGWRSTSNDVDNWYFLKNRDFLNRIVVESGRRLEKYVFETIDARGHLLATINGEIVGMLDPWAQADGLFGKYTEDGDEIDPGYVVNTSSDINPVGLLAQNKVNVAISVRPSPTSAMINLTILQVRLADAV